MPVCRYLNCAFHMRPNGSGPAWKSRKFSIEAILAWGRSSCGMDVSRGLPLASAWARGAAGLWALYMPGTGTHDKVEDLAPGEVNVVGFAVDSSQHIHDPRLFAGKLSPRDYILVGSVAGASLG